MPDERQVEVTVWVLIPEYHQVIAQAQDGQRYALTRHTRGINLEDLHEGQRLLCVVSGRMPRVLTARILAPAVLHRPPPVSD